MDGRVEARGERERGEFSLQFSSLLRPVSVSFRQSFSLHS